MWTRFKGDKEAQARRSARTCSHSTPLTLWHPFNAKKLGWVSNEVHRRSLNRFLDYSTTGPKGLSSPTHPSATPYLLQNPLIREGRKRTRKELGRKGREGRNQSWNTTVWDLERSV